MINKQQKRFNLALQDIISGISSWRIWLLLGWQDIRLRYRRSQLGPFWLTISMAVTIYTMGFLYGHLFKMDMKNYFPHLACGMLIWTLISSIVNEGATSLIDATGYLKQVKLSYVIFVLRVVVRNFIIFGHNIVVIIPVLIYAQIHFGWQIIALPIGLILIAINGAVYGVIIGMLCARFRDIVQIIMSLMQVIFFATPIIWSVNLLPAKYHFVVLLNPFAQFVDIIRLPLLGRWPTSYSFIFVTGVTIFGIILMFTIYWRARHRVIYWL